MKIIVGLGNPGQKYSYTRHNIGFLAVDALAQELGVRVEREECKSLSGLAHYQGEKILLLKPQTYMNLSGEAVRAALDYYKLTLDDLLIIYDDLDVTKGKIKLRQKGSSAGHNGIKSIIAHIGTQEFKRIKMGIGRPEVGDIISYVLGRFSPEEEPGLAEALEKSVQASLAFSKETDFSKVMNQYNI